jgi:lipopolysaccharide transport system permease protein
MSATERLALVIKPHRGLLGVNWGDLWRHRDLLYFLTWRDIKVRYKQTVLGVLWAVLQPFIKMVVFSVIFGRLARIDTGDTPYAIFVFAGLLPWQFFAESLDRSSRSVVESANIVTKVYFPRLVIPVASVGGCLVDFAISFAIMVALMVHFDVAVTVNLLMVPVLVVLTIVASLGTGVLVSALNVAYRDFRYVVPFLVQTWMFLTPVIYPVSLLPGRWKWVMALNPMAGIVGGYRSAVLGQPWDWGMLGAGSAVALALFVFGTAYFRNIERQFADII